ncbi:conserved hypothetical protein [Flavobacterium sp. 9AF]|uniref:hypothetical protein n=1 Tax=Flavobacterium sp. 9AF TaxID=2653142 RepID=UPI0012F46A6A|nr:hypothetical protein [Flavobacterium sp. 9AF]VXB66476.1 conserved hypothetical protein [Flavobacterium sp. 9AF]
MRNLKISILNNAGKMTGFLVDREIMSGLYITFDFSKVTQNYQSFDINYQNNKRVQMNSVVHNMDEITIVSTQLDEDNHVQFLIEENLSLKKLRRIPENIIPLEFKKMIRNAYKTYCENNFYPSVAS